MIGVVRYLKKLGVQNVGRFVSRLPPVLGYDVNTNLTPKVRRRFASRVVLDFALVARSLLHLKRQFFRPCEDFVPVGVVLLLL